jgi:hypothetical protein
VRYVITLLGMTTQSTESKDESSTATTSLWFRAHVARIEQWMKQLAPHERAASARLKAQASRLNKVAHTSIDYIARASAKYRKRVAQSARNVASSIES